MTNQERNDQLLKLADNLYAAENSACQKVAETAFRKHPLPPIWTAFPELAALLATTQKLSFYHGVAATLNVTLDLQGDIAEDLAILTERVKGRPN